MSGQNVQPFLSTTAWPEYQEHEIVEVHVAVAGDDPGEAEIPLRPENHVEILDDPQGARGHKIWGRNARVAMAETSTDGWVPKWALQKPTSRQGWLQKGSLVVACDTAEAWPNTGYLSVEPGVRLKVGYVGSTATEDEEWIYAWKLNQTIDAGWLEACKVRPLGPRRYPPVLVREDVRRRLVLSHDDLCSQVTQEVDHDALVAADGAVSSSRPRGDSPSSAASGYRRAREPYRPRVNPRTGLLMPEPHPPVPDLSTTPQPSQPPPPPGPPPTRRNRVAVDESGRPPPPPPAGPPPSHRSPDAAQASRDAPHPATSSTSQPRTTLGHPPARIQPPPSSALCYEPEPESRPERPEQPEPERPDPEPAPSAIPPPPPPPAPTRAPPAPTRVPPAPTRAPPVPGRVRDPNYRNPDDPWDFGPHLPAVKIGSLKIVAFGLENCDSELVNLCSDVSGPNGGGGAWVVVDHEILHRALTRLGFPSVDVILDARCFPDPGARNMTRHPGFHPEIIDRIVFHPRFQAYIKEVKRMWRDAIERQRQTRPDREIELTVAVYCRSGKHRSVAIAECLRHAGEEWEHLRFDGPIRLLSKSRWANMCKGGCEECLYDRCGLRARALKQVLATWRHA